MKTNITIVVCSLIISFSLSAQEPTHWRGKESEGKYEASNLLKEWTAEGPQMLWHFDDLGKGFSSPVFANGQIYCTGMIDTTGYLYIINVNGTLNKKYSYGPEFNNSYPGARSTPTIDGYQAYLVTGFGGLICMNLGDGSVAWSKNLKTDFNAEYRDMGFNESVVIDGDKLFFTPGGKEFNIVALNRHSGELIWKSAALGEQIAYCTPKLIDLEQRQILVTHTAQHVVCVDTSTGQLLWSYPHKSMTDVNPNTPIYQDHALLCYSGYGYGCVKLSLSDDGTSVEKVWSTTNMDSQKEGLMIVDGYVYGSGDMGKKGWYCIDWNTGELKYYTKDLSSGVIIKVADKFILYTEKGDLVLANPNPERLDIISQTKVELGEDQHWAHPVVYDGILYVRHGSYLIAYKISA